MSHILITGGAGFIGTRLTALALAQCHRVRVLDNLSPQIHASPDEFQVQEGAEFIRGDVNVRTDVERALEGVDTIIHLAAETGTGQSMYEIDRYYRVNVQGTALLFDVLANSSHSVRKIVLSSSRSVYGEGAYLCRNCEPQGARRFPGPRTPKQLAAHQWTSRCPECGGAIEATATREDDPLAPSSIYAATKLAQEELVRVACGSLGIAHAILRFQNVYGEGQSLTNPYTGILSIFSTRIQAWPVPADFRRRRGDPRLRPCGRCSDGGAFLRRAAGGRRSHAQRRVRHGRFGDVHRALAAKDYGIGNRAARHRPISSR